MRQAISAQRLMMNLAVYFVLLFGSVFAVGTMKPELLSVMPVGGRDAMEIAGIVLNEDPLTGLFSAREEAAAGQGPTARQVGLVSLFLGLSLVGTMLIMLPITWTYAATKREIGYRKNFVRALMVLPVCATTIVLLIQNNLALAFAAVRFRIALQEAIDGIYIFSSICVGLAAGIGHLGIAAVMAVFFCFANAVLWKLEYGKNPIDDARIAKKHAELTVSSSSTDATQQLP